jgi:hypothetical protein
MFHKHILHVVMRPYGRGQLQYRRLFLGCTVAKGLAGPASRPLAAQIHWLAVQVETN